jgi:hypothetical protein
MRTITCPYCHYKFPIGDNWGKGDLILCTKCNTTHLLYETKHVFKQDLDQEAGQNLGRQVNKKDLNSQKASAGIKSVITILLAVLAIGTMYALAKTDNNTLNANDISEETPKHINYDSITNVHDSINAAQQKVLDSFYQTRIGKKCQRAMDKLGCTKEEALDLLDGKIWIGMTIDMVKYQRGLPTHVNVSNYGSGEAYQSCWEDYTPSCFYFRGDGIVYAYN